MQVRNQLDSQIATGCYFSFLFFKSIPSHFSLFLFFLQFICWRNQLICLYSSLHSIFANCISVVLTYFSDPCISYKQAVRSRSLIIFWFSFLERIFHRQCYIPLLEVTDMRLAAFWEVSCQWWPMARSAVLNRGNFAPWWGIWQYL